MTTRGEGAAQPVRPEDGAAPWKRNESPEFAGVEGIKARHRQQLAQFEQWAAGQQWQRFHDSHYDWWMFPMDRDSRGQGAKWTVYEGDVTELKQDPEYVRRYLRGVELLMASWGWDLEKEAFVPNPSPQQRWHHWPVRLFKAASSLRLFGFETEFASLQKYARMLMERGESLSYSGHDLGWLFTAGINSERRSR